MKLELARITAAIAIAASLAACGTKTPEPAAPASPAPVATAPAPTAAPPPRADAPAPAGPWPTTGRCYLDTINRTLAPTVSVDRSEPATFAGWVANGAAEVPTDARLVLSGASGRHEFPLRAGGARGDVAKAFGNEALKSSGYTLSADLSEVPPGTYALAIEMGDPGTACPLRPKLTITE